MDRQGGAGTDAADHDERTEFHEMAAQAASVSPPRTDAASAPSFPLATARRRGYHCSAVDAFLAGARESFENDDDAVRSADIREASFPLVRRGYAIDAVDRALARLEDAFAARERERMIADRGVEVWVDEARTRAAEILRHVLRRRGRRFARTGILTFGYRIKEVDYVTDRIARYLRDGEELTAQQVRTAAFRMQRGGYREEQVDALLDATTEVILAVR